MKTTTNDKQLKRWAGALKNIPCFLIGNGPYLKKKDVFLLKDYFTIGINRAFKIIDPTILIWQDLALWQQHRNEIKKLKALKYCRRSSDSNKSSFYHFRMTGTKHRLSGSPYDLYGRGSSGPLSFQLAYALGCNPIILLGMDCRYDGEGNTDFYGKNPMHRQHTLPYCKDGLKWIKKVGKKRKIINCSKNKVFDKRYKTSEAIEMIGEQKIKGRKNFVKKLLSN